MSYDRYRKWATTRTAGPPTLSVVIPAYDEAERIVPTIGAIAAHLAESALSW